VLVFLSCVRFTGISAITWWDGPCIFLYINILSCCKNPTNVCSFPAFFGFRYIATVLRCASIVEITITCYISPYQREGLLEYPAMPSMHDIAYDVILCTFNNRSAPNRGKRYGPSGQAAWTESHPSGSNSPPASQERHCFGPKPLSLRPHWSLHSAVGPFFDDFFTNLGGDQYPRNLI
jgi:hypothetical protein